MRAPSRFLLSLMRQCNSLSGRIAFRRRMRRQFRACHHIGGMIMSACSPVERRQDRLDDVVVAGAAVRSAPTALLPSPKAPAPRSSPSLIRITTAPCPSTRRDQSLLNRSNASPIRVPPREILGLRADLSQGHIRVRFPQRTRDIRQPRAKGEGTHPPPGPHPRMAEACR